MQKQEATATSKLSERPPFECRTARNPAVFPWFYCGRCNQQLVPNLERAAAGRHCQSCRLPEVRLNGDWRVHARRPDVKPTGDHRCRLAVKRVWEKGSDNIRATPSVRRIAKGGAPRKQRKYEQETQLGRQATSIWIKACSLTASLSLAMTSRTWYAQHIFGGPRQCHRHDIGTLPVAWTVNLTTGRQPRGRSLDHVRRRRTCTSANRRPRTRWRRSIRQQSPLACERRHKSGRARRCTAFTSPASSLVTETSVHVGVRRTPALRHPQDTGLIVWTGRCPIGRRCPGWRARAHTGALSSKLYVVSQSDGAGVRLNQQHRRD